MEEGQVGRRRKGVLNIFVSVDSDSDCWMEVPKRSNGGNDVWEQRYLCRAKDPKRVEKVPVDHVSTGGKSVLGRFEYSVWDGARALVVLDGRDGTGASGITVYPPCDTATRPMVSARSVSWVCDYGGVVGSPWQSQVSGVDARSQSNLALFESGRFGQVSIDPSTVGAVDRLVGLLSRLAGKVSAVTSADGLLSLTAVFDDDMRLYVEVEPDGGVGAVISGFPSHAEDLGVTGISQLTEEFVVSAIRSPGL